MKKYLGPAICYLLSACTSGPAFKPADQPAPSKALVYFIRSDVGYGGLWTTGFAVNGVEVASTHDQGYSWIYLDQGEYQFCAYENFYGIFGHDKLNELSFKMPVSQGMTYYLEIFQEPDPDKPGYVRNEYHRVDETTGMKLLSVAHYQPAEQVQIPVTNDGC